MIRKQLFFLSVAVCIGGAIGAFIWAFLRITGLGQELLFTILPERLPIPCLILVICILGGFVIGIYEKKFHAAPENMEAVMAVIKKEGTYPCEHLTAHTIAALLPLVFGGSLGPEAGLTGIIAGLCFWAGRKFRYVGQHMDELVRIGLGASLGAIFGSPLFAYSFCLDEDAPAEFRKSVKMVAYITAILGGFGIFVLLGMLFGTGSGLPRLAGSNIGNRERFFVAFLIPVGVAAGILYAALHMISSRCFDMLKEKFGVVLCAVLGGICLGIFGMLVPFSMFSGEAQMEVLAETYLEYTPVLLIGIGIAKIFVTNVCLQSGWKGGHFFPVIFAGVSIGYGIGLLCSIDPVFAASVVTSALLGYMMKKPVAVVLLLMLCFPAHAIVWMLAAAAVGTGISAIFHTSGE